MLALILSYLARPKVAGALALIIALFGAFMWYGAKREASGYSSGSRSQLETDKAQFTQVVDQYKATLATAQVSIDTSNARLQELDSQVKVLNGQLVSLAAQRQQATQQVSQIPDSEVKQDIEAKLGGPLENAAVLRKADAIITDYPLVLKQIDLTNNKVVEINDKVSALDTKVTALTQQRDAAIDYGKQVTIFYVKAYAAAQVHHSKFTKIITFGLIKDRHINLPDPITLTK